MQLARVTRRDFDGEIKVVATVDQTVSGSIADTMAPGAEKLMCSTRPVSYTHLDVYKRQDSGFSVWKRGIHWSRDYIRTN